MFLISAKKSEKCKNFFRHFHTEILQIPAFFLPPKTVDSHGSRRLALVCRRNCGEKLQNLDEGPFFFFFLEITFKLDKNDEKIFGIFTMSSLQNVRTISGIFAEGENLEGTLA